MYKTNLISHFCHNSTIARTECISNSNSNPNLMNQAKHSSQQHIHSTYLTTQADKMRRNTHNTPPSMSHKESNLRKASQSIGAKTNHNSSLRNIILKRISISKSIFRLHNGKSKREIKPVEVWEAWCWREAAFCMWFDAVGASSLLRWFI